MKGTDKSSIRLILFSLAETLAAAIVFALLAPAWLVLAVIAYAHIIRHTAVQIEWNVGGGFADPVGLLSTDGVFCIVVVWRYRKRRWFS